MATCPRGAGEGVLGVDTAAACLRVLTLDILSLSQFGSRRMMLSDISRVAPGVVEINLG